MKKRNQIIFLSLFILAACNNPNNGIVEKPAKVENDTSLLIRRIDIANTELKRMHISDICDSVKFYLYNIFYDEEIKSNRKITSFFCFYDLEPIYTDSTNGAIVIRYNLVIHDRERASSFNEITSNMIDAQYKLKSGDFNFDKRNMTVLGKVYLEERLMDTKFSEIAAFLRQNENKASRWYLNEIEKRTIIR